MFDNSGSAAHAVRRWVDELSDLDGAGLTDAKRIDALTALEELKSAAAAAQARVTVAFDASQREQCATEAQERECRRSVAAQVALARREPPHAGNRHLGVARALVTEMPHTMAALTAGHVSEWRATLMVRETATLTLEDRRAVDAELAGRLPTMGNRQLAAEARAIGYRLDPTSLLRRTRGAESDRRVTVRPAPDTMTYVTGFLPVAQGVAVHAALRRHAESLHGQGDPRTVAQIMADTLVARCTGQERASGTPLEVQIVMTDRTLLGEDPEPARVVGYGPVPAWLGRRLVREADKVWVRRLYLSPSRGRLVAKEQCNYVKEAPGWSATVDGAEVTTTTPTGARHTTRPPPGPGMRVDVRATDVLDELVRDYTRAA